jgi:hypothetical protein
MSKSLLNLNGQSIAKKDFLSAIDNEIIHLHDTGDINHVMGLLNNLDELDSVAGHAKAKLLFASHEWYKVNVPGENFGDHVESTTSTKKVTVDRYITAWKYVENSIIPKEIAERPMRDLVPIAKTLSQGYDISKEQWRKIGLSTNDGELREVLRKIKGKAERKSAKVIRLARDGSLHLYKKGQAKKFLGFFDLKASEEDKEIAEEIEKFIQCRGVVRE